MHTDEHLAARACKGEDWAFEELAARHVDLVENKSHCYFASGETIEDFRQAALLGLYRAACSFDPRCGGTFRTWAGTVIHAAVVDLFDYTQRGKNRWVGEALRLEQPVSAGDSDDPVALGVLLASDERDPCQRAIDRETLAERVAIVTECSKTQRTVVARRLNGLSLVEAGNGLGTGKSPAKAADNALSHVRRKLAAAA